MTERAEGKQERRLDYLIEKMIDVLPAPSRAAIAKGLSRATRSRVTVGTVDACLGRNRSNAQAYGWIVPPVKRGINKTGDNRYFFALVEPDGSYTLDDNPQNRIFLRDGFISQVATAKTLMFTAVSALKTASKNTRKRTYSAGLADTSDDLAYLGRRVDRILEEVKAEEVAA